MPSTTILVTTAAFNAKIKKQNTNLKTKLG